MDVIPNGILGIRVVVRVLIQGKDRLRLFFLSARGLVLWGQLGPLTLGGFPSLLPWPALLSSRLEGLARRPPVEWYLLLTSAKGQDVVR